MILKSASVDRLCQFSNAEQGLCNSGIPKVDIRGHDPKLQCLQYFVSTGCPVLSPYLLGNDDHYV